MTRFWDVKLTQIWRVFITPPLNYGAQELEEDMGTAKRLGTLE
jgi:hypothetical protein